MAIFLPAFKKTNGSEGGWSKKPGDRGGETWGGISRVFHPEWEGWAIVDEIHRQHPDQQDFENALDRSQELADMKIRFYKNKIWDVMRGDEIENQILAEDIYDGMVNFGNTAGIKVYQEQLGLPQTGIMDDATLNGLNNK